MVTTTEEEEHSLSTTNVAHLGIIDKACLFSVTSKNRMWIIDTSASDYMTRDSGIL